jgi:hypothetical protein
MLSINSTEKEIENRVFKMSEFGYFANNIAFQVVSHKKDKQEFIRVLDNEVPILLPGCKDILCPMKEFIHYMNIRIHECNFVQFCKL